MEQASHDQFRSSFLQIVLNKSMWLIQIEQLLSSVSAQASIGTPCLHTVLTY